MTKGRDSLRHVLPAFLCAAVAVTLLLPAGARAHDDDHHRLQGTALKMSDPASNAGRRRFLFKTKKQLNINDTLMDVDPSQVTTSVRVRGTGASAGASGIIQLDPAKWSQVGKKGFRYRDDHKLAASSGIQKIQVKLGGLGGSLQVKAKGQYWPYEIAGPQDSVEVTLTIGADIYCAEYDAPDELPTNEAERVRGKVSDPPADCLAVCGNGVLEIGEECDDGNADDLDTCTNSCTGCVPQQNEFASTYEGIQALIFDNAVFGCTNGLCHGAATQGGLDLRTGVSYSQLVNVASTIDPAQLRVFPGDDDRSLLYEKIAAKTLSPPDAPTVPGSPMPSNSATVTPELLEALRLWIRGGASADSVVEGTAELLGSCLPQADPNKMPQPDVPAAGVGVQVAMPGYGLLAQSEGEVCVASFFDFTDLAIVPAEYRVNCLGLFPGTNDPAAGGTGECFTYKANDLYQDPQSHHSIVHIYAGDYDEDHAGWGDWRCYLGDDDGDPCDPTDVNACPGGGTCGGEARTGIACLSFPAYGPPDYGNFSNTAPTWSGSQEPTQSFLYPEGVYSLLPLRGVIVWNSHAFNLTSSDMNMESWINLSFTDDTQWVSQALFNADEIFTQNVPAFESREYCYTHTFSSGTYLFDISSHMHKRGKRFRYYLPPQSPCADADVCSPGNENDLFYTSYDYSDPITIEYDPPWVFSGTTEQRTIKFCGLYDNGETDPAEVKRRSTSPCPPLFQTCPNGTAIGGPCSIAQTSCLGGPNKGQLCNGDDGLCPDSVCDACPLRGGVTTEDEMFIAIGTYYKP